MSDIPIDTKGKRPAFFEDPAIDTVMTVMLEVMTENWTMRERLYALEKALTASGALPPNAVDDVKWSDTEKMAHEGERQRILNDAFRALNRSFVSRTDRQKDIDS